MTNPATPDALRARIVGEASDAIRPEQLLTLTKALNDIAEQLRQSLPSSSNRAEAHSRPRMVDTLASQCTDSALGEIPAERRKLLAEKAQQTYLARRARAEFFGDADLFGEPAWDILLDLYIADVNGKPVSVSSACIGSASPSTTGLRWLGILAEKQLIVREHDPKDQRRVLVRLSDQALSAMDSYLARFENSA